MKEGPLQGGTPRVSIGGMIVMYRYRVKSLNG
jgi:hypothetical protein